MEGKMEPVLVEKFAVDREFKKVDVSRQGESLKDMMSVTWATPEDLLP
jgi:hypothetical protein